MIKLFFLFIALTFSLQVSAQNMYRVKADKLNVRATNDPKSKIIGFIKQDENVVVLDSTDAKYFKVKVTNGEGWVSKGYLVRIASQVKSVPVTTPVSVAVPKVTKDSSSIILFAIVALILIIILYFSFKYGKNHKYLISFCTIVVLIIGYFCYVTFLKEKTVSGTFATAVDTQYNSFNFKSKDSVTVKDVYKDSLFTVKYVIDGDIIKLFDQQNSILLLIRDENTLVGEGFTKGVFTRK